MIGTPVVTLSAAQRAALLVGSGFDWSASIAWGQSMESGGGAYLFQGSSAAGETSIGYDWTNNTIIFKSEGVDLVTTTSLGLNPSAPTMQNAQFGDRIDIRAIDTRAGGVRSVVLRVGVNGCFGADTIAVNAGTAFTPLAAAVSMGMTPSSFAPVNNYVAAPANANVLARGVVIGDSICAPRGTVSAIGASLGRLGARGPIASLAQGGATAVMQLATWQASQYRTANVPWIYIQIGVNDIVGGANATTVLARIQAIVDDAATNSPLSNIIVGTITPARFYLTPAQYPIWQAINAGILGGGGTPITGADAIVNNSTLLGDASNCLLYHDATDALHTTEVGRYYNCVPIATALNALGVF